MPYSRTFTDTEIMAMAGYQLNPGHSDLDNEQPMSVRIHDGLWDHRDMRCLLGDIRQAKRDVRGAMRLAQSVAALNPDAGEIGAGRLAQLVTEARRIQL